MAKSRRSTQNKGKQKYTGISSSPLDKMRDGKEYQTLLRHKFKFTVAEEVKKSISEIKAVRGNPVITYTSNIFKPLITGTSIDEGDELPFTEMAEIASQKSSEVDVVILTLGGRTNVVPKLVNILRSRFKKVNFLIIGKAMSAGTIFSLSGDTLIMGKDSVLGPTDPQMPNRYGVYMPAQDIFSAIEELRKKCEEKIKENGKPSIVDLELLNRIDPKEIGRAANVTNATVDLITDYLTNYHYKSSLSVISDDNSSTEETKLRNIALNLCNYSRWKDHSYQITRDIAEEIGIIVHKAEEQEGLERAMRRMFALFQWMYLNNDYKKIFVSENYSIINQ